jgi:hypothetical protein
VRRQPRPAAREADGELPTQVTAEVGRAKRLGSLTRL